jgi:hypothetical protein
MKETHLAAGQCATWVGWAILVYLRVEKTTEENVWICSIEVHEGEGNFPMTQNNGMIRQWRRWPDIFGKRVCVGGVQKSWPQCLMKGKHHHSPKMDFRRVKNGSPQANFNYIKMVGTLKKSLSLSLTLVKPGEPFLARLQIFPFKHCDNMYHVTCTGTYMYITCMYSTCTLWTVPNGIPAYAKNNHQKIYSCTVS